MKKLRELLYGFVIAHAAVILFYTVQSGDPSVGSVKDLAITVGVMDLAGFLATTLGAFQSPINLAVASILWLSLFLLIAKINLGRFQRYAFALWFVAWLCFSSVWFVSLFE